MTKATRMILAAAVAGLSALGSLPANAFWGGWNPFNWFSDGWDGPWHGGGYPWYGGYPGYGGGYPWYGGYPGYGGVYPWYGGYPYGVAAYPYGGYAYPYAWAAPAYAVPGQVASTSAATTTAQAK
jgi:hypothetical protein